MKKLVLGIMTMVAILGTTGCDTMSNESTSLKEKGLDIAVILDFLAENEDYTKLFSASDDVNSIIAEIGKEDYTTPRAVFEIKGLEEAMQNQVTGNITLSQELKDVMGNKFSIAIGSQLNSMNGTDYLIASALLNHSESFILSDVTEPITYLYLYDSDYSVIVNFNPFHEGDVVSAFGSVILNSFFEDTNEATEVTSRLKEIGIDGVTITLVE